MSPSHLCRPTTGPRRGAPWLGAGPMTLALAVTLGPAGCTRTVERPTSAYPHRHPADVTVRVELDDGHAHRARMMSDGTRRFELLDAPGEVVDMRRIETIEYEKAPMGVVPGALVGLGLGATAGVLLGAMLTSPEAGRDEDVLPIFPRDGVVTLGVVILGPVGAVIGALMGTASTRIRYRDLPSTLTVQAAPTPGGGYLGLGWRF